MLQSAPHKHYDFLLLQCVNLIYARAPQKKIEGTHIIIIFLIRLIKKMNGFEVYYISNIPCYKQIIFLVFSDRKYVIILMPNIYNINNLILLYCISVSIPSAVLWQKGVTHSGARLWGNMTFSPKNYIFFINVSILTNEGLK